MLLAVEHDQFGPAVSRWIIDKLEAPNKFIRNLCNTRLPSQHNRFQEEVQVSIYSGLQVVTI